MMSIGSENDLVSVKVFCTLVKPYKSKVVLVFLSDYKAVVIEIADVYDSLLVELYNSFLASFYSQDPPLVFLDLNDVDEFVKT